MAIRLAQIEVTMSRGPPTQNNQYPKSQAHYSLEKKQALFLHKVAKMTIASVVKKEIYVYIRSNLYINGIFLAGQQGDRQCAATNLDLLVGGCYHKVIKICSNFPETFLK